MEGHQSPFSTSKARSRLITITVLERHETQTKKNICIILRNIFLTDVCLDNMCASNQLEETLKDQVRDVLLQRHRHLNEKHEKRHHDNGSSKIHLPIIRSLADIGRKYSLPKEMHNHNGR